ncbi:MAG: ribosome-binding factor A [bacterium]|nr:ribosome-binding factor A [bacterium]
MVSRREVQVSGLIAQMAAKYIARESSVSALMTVTRADVSSDLKNATILFSVVPATREAEALAFAKRARSGFRDYLRAKSSLHPTPMVDFQIDYGEKNRQRIDELTR